MDKQAASWVSFYGHRQKRELVGQIYFPFEGDDLDKDDQEKLDNLIAKYAITLLGTRVTFRFEGHCDPRGGAGYNRALALRRAKAVQAHFDGVFRTASGYFSSSTVSFGKRFAGQQEWDLERRVDIISSFVPKRPPIRLQAIPIQGKLPKKMVRMPIQFLDIERYRLLGADGPHGTTIPSTHEIIIEKYAMVEESRSFPYNLRTPDHKVHSSLPTVMVSRCIFDYRKPQASDMGKGVAKVVLGVLAAAADTAGGYDFGEGIPSLKPPNWVHKSWSDYEASLKGGDRDFLVYKGRRFSN